MIRGKAKRLIMALTIGTGVLWGVVGVGHHGTAFQTAPRSLAGTINPPGPLGAYKA